MDVEKLINLDTLLRYASIFVPGILFFLYLYYLLGDRLNENILFLTSLNNNYIITIIFIVLIFFLGSYVYLFSLIIYSRLFKYSRLDKKENNGHLYWRHFSASVSFMFTIIFFIEFLKIIFSLNNLILDLIIIGFIITTFKTILLYLDLKDKREEKQIKFKKSFDWDYKGIEQKYYNNEGLTIIVADQRDHIDNQEHIKREKNITKR